MKGERGIAEKNEKRRKKGDRGSEYLSLFFLLLPFPSALRIRLCVSGDGSHNNAKGPKHRKKRPEQKNKRPQDTKKSKKGGKPAGRRYFSPGPRTSVRQSVDSSMRHKPWVISHGLRFTSYERHTPGGTVFDVSPANWVQSTCGLSVRRKRRDPPGRWACARSWSRAIYFSSEGGLPCRGSVDCCLSLLWLSE